MKLNKKEARLYKYKLHCAENKLNPTIGEACKALKTTVFTLLGKTEPNLNRKIKEYNERLEENIEIIASKEETREICKELGLEHLME
jgi:hypothetical protein